MCLWLGENSDIVYGKASTSNISMQMEEGELISENFIKL
jgi:hypothetical protein